MEKELAKLIEETSEFGKLIRSGKTDDQYLEGQTYKIIEAAAEVYKRDYIKLYIPCYDNGVPGVYREADRNYIPVCTSIEEINKTGCSKFTETNLKDLCSYLYDNINNYQLLSDPEAALKAGASLSDLTEYADRNIKLEGFILDPSSDHLFGFEGWELQAVMFKGMGVATFDIYDADTGEKKHEL